MKFLFSSHLDDGERILAVAHRHPLILKIDSFKTLMLGIVLPVFAFLFFPQGLIIYLVWGAAGFLGMAYHFIDWYFDAWLITNIGLIDIERNGLFERSATRVEYHMIEGIGYTVKGVLQTLFNYGDITVDKLGAQTQIVLKDAASPRKIERKIMKYQEKFIANRSIRDHQALKDMLADMIAYNVQQEKIKNPHNFD